MMKKSVEDDDDDDEEDHQPRASMRENPCRDGGEEELVGQKLLQLSPDSEDEQEEVFYRCFPRKLKPFHKLSFILDLCC